MKLRSFLPFFALFLTMGATVAVIVTHPERDRIPGTVKVRPRLDLWKKQSRELYLARRSSDAERRLLRILEVEPDHLPSRFLLCRIYWDTRRFPEAETALRELLRFHPEDLTVLNNLGMVQLRLGKVASAREKMERVTAAAPNNAVWLANCAAVLRATGEKEAAGRCNERALQLLAGRPVQIPMEVIFIPPAPPEKGEK